MALFKRYMALTLLLTIATMGATTQTVHHDTIDFSENDMDENTGNTRSQDEIKYIPRLKTDSLRTNTLRVLSNASVRGKLCVGNDLTVAGNALIDGNLTVNTITVVNPAPTPTPVVTVPLSFASFWLNGSTDTIPNGSPIPFTNAGSSNSANFSLVGGNAIVFGRAGSYLVMYGAWGGTSGINQRAALQLNDLSGPIDGTLVLGSQTAGNVAKATTGSVILAVPSTTYQIQLTVGTAGSTDIAFFVLEGSTDRQAWVTIVQVA